VDVGVVERRLPQQAERLGTGEHPREFPAEQFVDDEPRVVVLDVQVPQEAHEGGDVDREVAVGEHLVDGRAVLLAGHVVDVGSERLPERVADIVYEWHHDVSARARPVAFLPDRVCCQPHDRHWGGAGLNRLGRLL
jgi:hypothetical protein